MNTNSVKYKNHKLLTIFIYLLLTILSIHATITQLSPQSNISLTIYNNNFAIVKDRRQLHFVQGYTMLYFVDVATNIQPETVTFKKVENIQRQSSVNQIIIIQQNFDMNVMKSQRVLKYYIGQFIQIYTQQKGQIKNIKGKLLSYRNKFVIQNLYNKTIQSLNNVQGILLAGIPQGFFTKPTLNWKVYSNKTQNAVCQVAYRTTGLKWSSTYNIILYNQQKLIDLGGWVTIDNKSGKKYENTRIKLVAGQVNLVRVKTKVNKIKHLAVMATKDSEGGKFVEKTFADYHMYTLDKLVTLEQNQIKQIQFIPKVYGVGVQQYYQVIIQASGQPQTPISQKYIKLLNSQKNKLGIPFPAGVVRVFQQNPQGGALQFIGQDSLNHTPKNENITIYIGKSSAIQGIKKQISRITTNNIGGYSAQLAMKITNNRQKQAQIVVKFNNIYKDNLKIQMINGQLPIKISASQYQWRNIVQAQGIWEFRWTQNY